MARAVFLTEDATLPTAAAPVLSLDQITAAFPELEVLEQIGRGGMGVVYKARQKSLNRLVALKLLAPERVDDPQFAARFEKEAQALAALNHPNIVTVHNFGHVTASSHQPSTIDNPLPLYFLLMEFVDGVNLRQAMSAGRFTPEQALAIVPPVCEALQYAHDHGIVHRDIKPENLLLDKDGRVKIADFGIAKILGAADSPVPGGEDQAGAAASQPVGTPRYMAPEQQTDPRRVDHRADIYSLGVVLYELLTGEAPGSKLTPPSQRVQIDVRLDEIVLRALNEKPEMRWQTAADLRTSVQAISGKPDAQEVTSAAHSPWGNLILPLVPSACCALGWWLEMMRIDELRRFEVGAPDWLNLAKFWLDGLFIVGGVALAWRLMLRDYDGKLSLTHFGRGLCLVTAVLGVFLALSWAVEAPLTRESMEAGAHQTGWRLNRWNAVWWRRWLWWAVATPFLVQPMWWIIYSVKAGWEQKRRKQTPPITTPSRNAPEKTEGRPNEAPFTDGGRTWWHKALTSIVIALLIAIPIREWVLQPFHQSAPAQQATATERMKESVEEKRRAAMASTPPLATGLREQLQAQLAERSVKLGSSHPDVMLLRQTLAEIAKRDDDAPAVSDAENTSERLLSAVVKPIEFSVGEQRFAPGDSITIESVEATSPALGRGDIVVVKGRFVLQSTNEAMLALYLGHIANGGRSKTLPEQTRMITKGSGVFELRCAINYDGRLHVRFYPKDRSGAFGEIWVGPAAQSSAAKPKSVSSTPVAIPRPAITQTASDKAGVIAQIQTAFDAVAKLGNMEQGRRYEVPVAGVLETSPGDDFLRRRTGREVFDSGLSCGCGDHALAFMHLMEPTGLELLMVDGAEISFRALEHHWSGHVVAAVKIPTDGTWLLVDPTQRKIIDEDWQRDAKTFYDNRFWIGYAGPISGYPAHTPDELREFLGKTLATVPPEVFARQMMKFRFKLDASMFDASGKCVNAYAEKMNELQDGLLRKHKITPAREVDVLLVKGGEDASGTMTYTEDRGWVATVGLRSACSSGYIDYMNQQVARKVNVR